MPKANADKVMIITTKIHTKLTAKQIKKNLRSWLMFMDFDVKNVQVKVENSK